MNFICRKFRKKKAYTEPIISTENIAVADYTAVLGNSSYHINGPIENVLVMNTSPTGSTIAEIVVKEPLVYSTVYTGATWTEPLVVNLGTQAITNQGYFPTKVPTKDFFDTETKLQNNYNFLPELPGFFRGFQFALATVEAETFNRLIRTSTVDDAYEYLVRNWNALGSNFRGRCVAEGYAEDCSRVINHFSNAGNYYKI